jgi:hypothetical protein
MIYAGILYVAKSCAPSDRLLNNRVSGIFIQYVDDMRAEDLPEWLDGTPLLVDTQSGYVARGYTQVTTAVAMLTRVPKS